MNKDKGYSTFTLKLMLICTILILGSSIVFSLKPRPYEVNNDNDNSNKSNEEEQLVNTLYSYVTYGRENEPMYYFLRNKQIDNKSFDEVEKLRYAFQFVNEEDIYDKTNDSFKINGDIYDKYIKKIFGNDTSYNKDKNFVIYTNQIFRNAILNVTYDKENNYYLVTKINGFFSNNDIKLFYTKFDSYKKDNENGTITITEKVIYTDSIYTNNLSEMDCLRIYKDIKHTLLLEEINNPTNEFINTLSIDKYYDKANTITYTFKKDINGNYYFDNSIMEI